MQPSLATCRGRPAVAGPLQYCVLAVLSMGNASVGNWSFQEIRKLLNRPLHLERKLSVYSWPHPEEDARDSTTFDHYEKAVTINKLMWCRGI